MVHLLKPIRLSLKYRWSLLASMANALAIGLLWSVSITAIYPVLEVVFEGHTVHDWFAEAIQQSRAQLAEYDGQIDELNSPAPAADGGRAPEALASSQGSPLSATQIQTQLDRIHALRNTEARQLHWQRQVYTWLQPYLPTTPFDTLMLMMAMLVVATVAKGCCLVAQAVLVARVSERTVMDLRRIYFRNLLLMDQLKIDQRGTAQVMTMLSHNISLVGTGLRSLYGQSIREPLKMFACLVGAALISWRLLMLSLIVAPVGAACLYLVSRRVKSAALEHMGGIAAVLQTLLQTINGIRIVRVFNRERSERRRFRGNCDTVYQLSQKMHLYDAVLHPITELVGVAAISIAVLGGAWLVLNQESSLLGLQISERPLKPSAVILFFGMLAGASGPARKLSGIYNNLVRANMASLKLSQLFEQPPQVVAQQPRQKTPQHAHCITFDDVCFAYRPMHRILHHINVEIPFGQTVAIVGHNGCGKSTLMQLLCRFYDPVVGRILIDGVDIRHVNPRKLRKQMAMITQEPLLFNGTVAENIAYGNPTAGREQIEEAARKAHVTDFLEALPAGWDTPIGDQGKLLSGGQRQRIALAPRLRGSASHPDPGRSHQPDRPHCRKRVTDQPAGGAGDLHDIDDHPPNLHNSAFRPSPRDESRSNRRR